MKKGFSPHQITAFMTPSPETYLHHFEKIDAPMEQKIAMIEWLQALAHEAYDRALESHETVDRQGITGDFDGNNQQKMIDCEDEKLRTRFNKSR